MRREGERNFRLILEYDGSNYHGWQRQKGLITVQEVVESCLGIMLDRPVKVRASGRTDAGVHAFGQVVNFYAATNLSPEDFQNGLNSLLPEDVVVVGAEEVDLSFHARFSAKRKVYCYRILNRRLRFPLLRNYAWHIPAKLDIEAMRDALKHFLGEHDFSAFMASKSSVKSRVRTVFKAELDEFGSGNLVMTFEANGFLRHMVRIMVGTVVEVGLGKRVPGDIPAILKSLDRLQAGRTAPAHGLYLMKVIYDESKDAGENDALRVITSFLPEFTGRSAR
ncbi:MAG TPA: tRNA pseudouridine(38-40) synthase TruA [Thermodesulforhabdus norvegica]|uniref:tRNA pseudouridine synthase A n=1 Tax=Thermodesulforhabdus norvegica TaxID=39841 RepID=A0A7C0WV94_9BACT|nr:tRNA pseudouridine(38-40) synthase TruA [Deltaproteobacteria bacterium]MBW2068777.1 tRNA pseudouridine(38-40) synthase TruA [Deltaproteobacteria bacterium]HDL90026.1 tRNA pseudouridine(38-40) synthase TruA [Thermodesulforhabdus norvegica]